MDPKKVAEAALPTEYGEFRILGFESAGESLVALVMGTPRSQPATLVRIHSQCLTGDTFRSSRCDCGQQLDLAFRRISEAGHGILIYQPAEGRGIGLMNKLLAYQIQDRGHDTVEANRQLGFGADERSYAFPAAVLRMLEVRSIRLMSNNPDKLAALETAGFDHVERVPLEIPPSDTSESYLRTKKDKLGHLLSGV
jgi:GTP cyclohydrolase II